MADAFDSSFMILLLLLLLLLDGWRSQYHHLRPDELDNLFGSRGVSSLDTYNCICILLPYCKIGGSIENRSKFGPINSKIGAPENGAIFAK